MVNYSPKSCKVCSITFKPMHRGTAQCSPECYIAFKVSVVGDCWMWPCTKGTPDFYGIANFRGEQWVASRFSYHFLNGPIPDGMLVRHKCDTPGCVNPDHLEIGTALDNERDKYERGRAKMGEEHHSSLSLETARQILEADGTIHAIAKRYHVDFSTVANIKRGNHWSVRQA